MKRFSVHYAFDWSDERPVGAVSAFKQDGNLWLIPLSCGPKTPYAVACWAADENLPLVLWVEFKKPQKIERVQAPVMWEYEDGEKAVGYARTSGLAQFVGESEPRRFVLTYTWSNKNGQSLPYSGGWYVELQ